MELYHFGIKGMRWGVRRTPSQLGSTEPSWRTRREASRDAKEYARAKMFYGDGAGNRRKLIYASVNSKSKKDPMYKKAFNDALSKQDMAKHASKARSERHRKDAKAKVRKTARSAINIATGNLARASAIAVAAYSLYKIGKTTGINYKVAAFAKRSWSEATTAAKLRRGRRFCSRIVVGD